jgi:hypothetical protein
MPATRGRLRRPLLELRRADTHEICARLQWAPVRDPMNDELRHRRVWLRREVMPSLERGAQRDLVEVLARQAALLRDDDELLDALAAEHTVDDANALAALPNALARRVVRRWLGPPPPSSKTVESVLEVARGERRAVELPGGHRVERVGARLHLVTGEEMSAGRVAPTPLTVPGRTYFGAVAVDTWVEAAPPVAWPDGRLCAVVDADRVGVQAIVHDALIDAGVPAARRAGAPIVTCVSDGDASAESVLWVVGYRIDDRVRVTSQTRRYLWMSVAPC